MTWLIRLYPPAWRRRYGQELADLLAVQPASIRTAIDLMAGAADAWLNPQSSTAAAAAHPKGDHMVAKMLKLRCAGEGANYTRRDALKSAGAMLVVTAGLMFLLRQAMNTFGHTPFLESLFSMSWLFAFLFSQRYTELKGRSAGAQLLLIGVPALIILGIAWTSAWINN